MVFPLFAGIWPSGIAREFFSGARRRLRAPTRTHHSSAIRGSTHRSSARSASRRRIRREGDGIDDRLFHNTSCTVGDALAPPQRCPRRQGFVAHSWPKRRWTIGSTTRSGCNRSEKYLQMGQFRGARRRACCARVGLSRRGSRARVPSLPSLEVPAFRQVMLSHQTRAMGWWPNPVAQTNSTTYLQRGTF
jgi:hypothetical protein